MKAGARSTGQPLRRRSLDPDGEPLRPGGAAFEGALDHHQRHRRARLARLARRHQVFAVTHQPQVAARGRRQWLILRTEDAVSASELDEAARVEEIARMMSGSGLTDEARAAAKRLLQEGGK